MMRKEDFPIFKQKVYGKPLVYFDSAASAQKPKCVMDAMSTFALTEFANVHRGIYLFSEKSTELFEKARASVADFIHATSSDEIVFTRNASESLNLLVQTLGRTLKKRDEVIVSIAEHHSNIVPWQIWAAEHGIKLNFLDITEEGFLDFDKFDKLLSSKTKIVSITQASNVLGAYFDVKKIIEKAHLVGAKTIIDGCQGIVHQGQNMQTLDCDFYVFSAHKLYGPTGLGVLYGKKKELQNLPVWQAGGDMVQSVSIEKTVFAEPPAKFEAGTPAIIEAIGLDAALSYINEIGMDKIESYEQEVSAYLYQEMKQIKGLKIYGPESNRMGLVSFTMEGIHPQDAAMFLDKQGVFLRTGYHCAEPLHKRLGITSSMRASLGLYNDKEDVDIFVKALDKARHFFR
ncbi:MAG: SufS family cysteine desulfurase [Alphaproteobacteria bacterium]|nr:SufS family cysteine desulfurase [Alphaproteobacteria bacterium]